MQPQIKITQILHFSLVIGIIVAYVIIGKLQTLDFIEFSQIEMGTLPFLLVPIGAVLLSNALYKQALKRIPSTATPQHKWGGYQVACLLRWALLEGAAFFILFVSKEFLLVGILLILYMAYLYPSQARMESDLKSVQF